MSTPRKLGIALCLLGFAAVCVLALVLNTSRPFAGLQGIQSNLLAAAEPVVSIDAPGSRVIADGRDLEVQLPEFVNPTYDAARLKSELLAIDGVRSVKLVGDPAIPVSVDEAPDPLPTTLPVAEPTAAPVPEPTAAPTPEPTTAPAPAATAEPDTPSLAEIVDGIDLGAVRFEPGTARFTAQDTAVLDAVADQLQGASGGSIQVQTHTDNVGDPDVNLLLSQDRADAVVAYLIDRGVDSSLLSARGFGAQAPIADNSTEQGRAANQRVVLVVEGN